MLHQITLLWGLCVPLFGEPPNPQQDDFLVAQKDYARVAAEPSRVVHDLERRVAQVHQRIEQLGATIVVHERELEALNGYEVAQFLALKSQFDGDVLESRLEEKCAEVDIQRGHIEDELRMEREHREDAERRLRGLQIDLRLAQIRAGVSGGESSIRQSYPRSEEFESRARDEKLARALRVGRFAIQAVPRRWLERANG